MGITRFNSLYPKISILCTIGVLPLVFCTSTIDPVMAPRFLFLSVMNLLLLAGVMVSGDRLFARRELGALRSPLVLMILLHIIFSGFSMAAAFNVSEGIFVLLKMLMVFEFFIFLSMSLINGRVRIGDLSQAATILAIVFSIVGIMQFHGLGFGWIPGNGHLYGIMAGKNLFSSALFLILPLVLYGWICSTGVWRWGAGVGIAAMLYLIIVAQTRAVWLAGVIGALAVLVFMRQELRELVIERRYRMISRRLVYLFVFAVIALAAALVPTATDNGKMESGHDQLLINTSTRSLEERLSLWEKSIRMYVDNPYLGVGPGQWKLWIPKYGTEGMRSESGELLFLRPHNDIIWILAETGPLGVLSHLLIFVFALLAARKSSLRAVDPPTRVLAIVTFFGIAGYLVISLFSFPRERVEHQIFVTILLSVAVFLRPGRGGQPGYPGRAAYRIIFWLFFLCTVCSIPIGWMRLYSEIHTNRAVAAASRQDWQTVITEVAAAEWPVAGLDPTGTPIIRLQGIAHFAAGDYEAALRIFQEAHRLNPYHIQILDHLSTCYAISGDYASAIEYAGKVMSLSPHHLNALLNLTSIYYNMGDRTTAREYFSRIRNNRGDPRYASFLEALRELPAGDSL